MGKIIKGKFPAAPKIKGKTATGGTPAAVYQLKISLLYSEPLIWRRLQVPGHLTLAKLHEVLQLAMGWTDSHLHQFTIGDKFYAPPVDDGWGEIEIADEKEFTVAALEADMRQRFIYDYDFGDSWRHEVKIEKVILAEEKTGRPMLLAGERACLPEDVGGIPGYENFLAVLADPDNEEHGAMLAWCGGDFDPDYLDLAGINEMLKKA